MAKDGNKIFLKRLKRRRNLAARKRSYGSIEALILKSRPPLPKVNLKELEVRRPNVRPWWKRIFNKKT